MEEFKSLVRSVQAREGRTGAYDSRLTPAQSKVLDAYVAWLPTHGVKSEASRRSYRSYVAKALVLGTPADKLTSDQRSAVRKLGEFLDEVAAKDAAKDTNQK